MRFEMHRVGAFMRHKSMNHGDFVTDGAIRLMARRGAGEVTLRALADEFKCTPQAVRQWFGGADQMWEQIAMRFGQRWVSSLTDTFRTDPDPLRKRSTHLGRGPHHLLPFDAEEIGATRAWLAMTQRGREDETVGKALAPSEVREVSIVMDYAEQRGLAVDPLVVDLLMAVIRGLRHAVCATETPMSLARAHAVLEEALTVLPSSSSPASYRDTPLF